MRGRKRRKKREHRRMSVRIKNCMQAVRYWAVAKCRMQNADAMQTSVHHVLGFWCLGVLGPCGLGRATSVYWKSRGGLQTTGRKTTNDKRQTTNDGQGTNSQTHVLTFVLAPTRDACLFCRSQRLTGSCLLHLSFQLSAFSFCSLIVLGFF